MQPFSMPGRFAALLPLALALITSPIDRNADRGRYQAANRWSGGSLGDPITLTWSIVPDGTQLTPTQGQPCTGSFPLSSNLISTFDGLFGATNWQSAVHAAFEAWDDVGGVTFQFLPTDDGAPLPATPGFPLVRGDIRVSGACLSPGTPCPPCPPSCNPLRATTGFPDAGDIVLNTSACVTAALVSGGNQPSLFFRNLIAHEIGHALGLEHSCPEDQSKLMEGGLGLSSFGPQDDDIRGIQRLYGDPYEPNDSASQAWSLGTNAAGAPLQHASIDAAGDVDHYAFDVATCSALTITAQQVGSQYQLGAPIGLSCPSSSVNTAVQNPVALELRNAAGTLVASAGNDVVAHNSMISLPAIVPGSYVVRVAGTQVGMADVQRYSLSVALFPATPQPLPSITTAPASQAACLGSPIALSVAATGSFLSYQWLKNGVPIPQANAPTLVIPSFGLIDAGSYVVRVYNFCSQIASPPAVLSVAPIVLVLNQSAGPASLVITNACGPPGGPYFTAFSVDAANNALPGMGWWFGLHVAFDSLLSQWLLAAPPFIGALSVAGTSSFTFPAGSLPPSLSGVAVHGLTITFEPAQSGITNVSPLASVLIQ